MYMQICAPLVMIIKSFAVYKFVLEDKGKFEQ